MQLRLHGTEATILQGEAESSRTAQPEEEEAWGGKGGKTHHSLLKGGCKENRARFFSAVPSVRTTGNGHKLEQRRVPLNTK